jgi:hypothetical protein
LFVQAQPVFTVLHPNQPSVELKVFESVGSKRRLPAESTVVAFLTNPKSPPTEADYVEGSAFHSSSLLDRPTDADFLPYVWRDTYEPLPRLTQDTSSPGQATFCPHRAS